MALKVCRFHQTPRGCRYGDNCRYIHQQSNSVHSPSNKQSVNRKRDYAEIDKLWSPPKSVESWGQEIAAIAAAQSATTYNNTNSEPKKKRQRIDDCPNYASKLQVDENMVIGPTCLWAKPLKGKLKNLKHEVIEIQTLNPHNKAQLKIFDYSSVQFFTLETSELLSAKIANLQEFNAVNGKTFRYLKRVLPTHNVNEDCIQLTIPVKNQCKMYRAKFHCIESHPFTMSIGCRLMVALGITFRNYL